MAARTAACKVPAASRSVRPSPPREEQRRTVRQTAVCCTEAAGRRRRQTDAPPAPARSVRARPGAPGTDRALRHTGRRRRVLSDPGPTGGDWSRDGGPPDPRHLPRYCLRREPAAAAADGREPRHGAASGHRLKDTANTPVIPPPVRPGVLVTRGELCEIEPDARHVKNGGAEHTKKKIKKQCWKY